MLIMMVGVISIELDFSWGFQKYVTLVVLSEKWLSGTSPYLEDILHPPELPDGDHDGYGTWIFNWILPEVSKNI